MTKFTHIHSSGRFDRSPASATRAARVYNSRADLVTGTEFEAQRRENAIRKANGTAFGFVSGDKSYANDCYVSYKKSRFKLLYSEQFVASRVKYYTSPGRLQAWAYTTIAVLEDLTNGKVLVVSVIHLPHAIESDLAKKRRPVRVRKWIDALNNTRTRTNALAVRYKASGRMIVADYNLDFKKAWARALVKSMYPAYHLTWKNVKISGGTLGRRLIDATLLRGRIKTAGARLFKDDDSSDHRPYIEVLEWT